MIDLACFDIKELKIKNYCNNKILSSDELEGVDYLILAHITSSILIDSIIKNGIMPSGISGNSIEDNLPSDMECVYLLSRLDEYYFDRAEKSFGGIGIIILVRVKKERLLADENVLSPNQLENLATKDALLSSLSFGQCKCKGVISKGDIIGMYDKHGNEIVSKN